VHNATLPLHPTVSRQVSDVNAVLPASNSLLPSATRKQAVSCSAKQLASKPQGDVYVEPLRPDTKLKVTGRMITTLACVTHPAVGPKIAPASSYIREA
jgi:hypothetical protein